MAKKNGNGNGKGGERIAIVAGLRTPFARSGTAYKGMSALDLGRAVVSEIVQRTELDPAEIDAAIDNDLRLALFQDPRARGVA